MFLSDAKLRFQRGSIMPAAREVGLRVVSICIEINQTNIALGATIGEVRSWRAAAWRLRALAICSARTLRDFDAAALALMTSTDVGATNFRPLPVRSSSVKISGMP